MTPTQPRFELCRVPVDSQWEAVIVPVAQLKLDTPMNRRGFLGAGFTASAVLGALATTRGALAASSRERSFCTSARAHTSTVAALAISPDGKTLVSGSYDSSIKLWRLPDGALLTPLTGHSDSINTLVIGPDGKTLASGSDDGSIRLWRLPDGALLKKLTGHPDRINTLAISPDGMTLASGGNDKSIRLWSLPDGTLVKTLTGHPDRINTLAISPDGMTLASGGNEESIRLWSLPNGTLLKTLTGHTGFVNSLAISPDGKTLASGSNDKSIRLWSLPDGALLKTLTGHTGQLYSLVINPDGKTLASGSDDGRTNDGSIWLWSLPDGALLKTLTGHTDRITSLATSPDLKTLVSGSRDHSIRLWSLPGGTLIRCLMDIAASLSTVRGVIYQLRNEYGQSISYTLPCGSPIPLGAACTCNCVPGSLTPNLKPNSWSEPCPGGPAFVPPGSICTCNCVPVCQAHRLLHSDPAVRTMAEELLLYMGPGQFNYMRWAADNAEPLLQARIDQIMAAIEAGARPDPERWPSAEKCCDRLHDADEVVAIMAAQTLYHLRRRNSMALDPSLQERIDTLLSEAQQRPWFVRYAASGQPRENV